MISFKHTGILILSIFSLNQIFAHKIAEINFPFQHNIACSLYSTCPQASLLNQGSILISSARRLSPSGQIFSKSKNSVGDTNQTELKDEFVICNPLSSQNIKMYEVDELPEIGIFLSEDLQTLHIRFEKKVNDIQFYVFNVAGEIVVKQLSVRVPETQINISHLPKGLYFIKFNYQNQSVVKKFIKL